jgi:uncharacterized protein YlxP (DUF503 family)
MIVGVGRVVLRLAENDSLKGKRRVVKAIKDRVVHHHHAAVAEVDDQDLWQQAVIGLAVVGNDSSQVNSRLDKIVDYVESLHLAEVLDAQLEIIHFSD